MGRQDWEAVRAVRLRALQDAPLYFWATYEDELAKTEEWWQGFTDAGAWFMAFNEAEPVGIAAAVTSPELPANTYEVISMWVAPEARGSGVGDGLVNSLAEWARSEGLEQLRLEVTDGNDAAARLYERCGFRFTGNTEPHPRDPNLYEREMRLEL